MMWLLVPVPEGKLDAPLLEVRFLAIAFRVLNPTIQTNPQIRDAHAHYHSPGDLEFDGFNKVHPNHTDQKGTSAYVLLDSLVQCIFHPERAIEWHRAVQFDPVCALYRERGDGICEF